MKILTPKQIGLLKIAKDKKIIKEKDIRAIYSNETYGRKIVKRLVELEYLRKVHFFQRWEYSGKNFSFLIG
jgi:hypothetical protein